MAGKVTSSLALQCFSGMTDSFHHHPPQHTLHQGRNYCSVHHWDNTMQRLSNQTNKLEAVPGIKTYSSFQRHKNQETQAKYREVWHMQSHRMWLCRVFFCRTRALCPRAWFPIQFRQHFSFKTPPSYTYILRTYRKFLRDPCFIFYVFAVAVLKQKQVIKNVFT